MTAIVFPEQRVEAILAGVLDAEGGDKYTDDPTDPGKETRWGITIAVARADGYTGPMRELPKERALAIYRKRYVSAPGFDKVLAIDPSVGAELIDTGVNMGTATAAMWLQRWLNGFNDTGSRYGALHVDGQLGPVSLDALRAFVRWRGPMGVTALLRGLNGSQAARYLEITETNPAQRKYLYGWVLNRVELPSA